MGYKDFIFELEGITYSFQITRATLDAVQGRLEEEMGEDNQAILHGISSSMWKLDRQLRELFNEGMKTIGR